MSTAHLKCMKMLPANPKREEPNKGGPAGINCGSASATEPFGNAKPEEIVKRNGGNAAKSGPFQGSGTSNLL